MSHESPTIFWSLVLGAVGPVMVLTVPPIRRSLGYVPPEHFPTSYPRSSLRCRLILQRIIQLTWYNLPTVPQRARQPVSGYDDE